MGAERELVGEKNTESPVGSGRGRCLQGGFEAPETLFGRAKKARQKKESGGVSSSAAKRSGVGFFTPSASLFAKKTLESPVESGSGRCFEGGFKVPERLSGGGKKARIRWGFGFGEEEKPRWPFLGGARASSQKKYSNPQ